MSFSRLSLFLRLPMAALICGQLVFLGADFSLDDYFISSVEEVVVFDERDEDKFFDAGLTASTFKVALIPNAGKVLSGLGDVPGDATLELRATGPPNA